MVVASASSTPAHPDQESYVLYWMQQAQRTQDNPALQEAMERADSLQLPLLVCFVLIPDYPDANLRHYSFMLDGLVEVFSGLAALNIMSVLVCGEMVSCVAALAQKAAEIYTDLGYLKHQRQWRDELSTRIDIPLTIIETEALFPVADTFPKAAYGALSIRKAIYKQLQSQMSSIDNDSREALEESSIPQPVHIAFSPANKASIFTRIDSISSLWITNEQPDWAAKMLRLTDHLQTNNAVLPIAAIRGGYIAAKKRLTYFTQSLLSKFQEFRSDPATDVQSYLSPYLHFGQISMREVLNTALMYAGISKPEFGELILHYKPGTHPEAAINGLLEMFEQGVIRRELSYNYCWFQPDYDSYFALPRWAIASLTDHLPDSRPYLYGLEALETACTHDPYWNAAQQEMLHTGMMHGYMRMYWGKKILLWSKAPEDAFYTALYLNNKYSLDGRDANSFAGVAWCFGLHDRPWGSKPVFGNVRCMNEQGLTRKFDMQTYLKRIKRF